MASATEVGTETQTFKRDSARDHAGLRIVPARHPWRIVGSVVAAFVIAVTLHSVFTNERWGWAVFAQ
jgi:polar amino acid transport system permease protein